MKPWQNLLLGLFFGLLSGALVLLLNTRPRGQAISLPPLPTAAPLVVHLSGAVAKEGLYELPPGSRLDDALRAAGGLLDGADTDKINRAARLADGQKISIPSRMAAEPPASAGPQRSAAVLEPAPDEGLINLNTATLDELDTLPGIGASKAADIIAYREKTGPFQAIEDIQNVPGIGPKIFENIRDQISVE